jgi:methylmalonyl-CoA/ethylmalonyl-CoA epimerase
MDVMPATAHLDHVAVGTTTLTDGWDLFGGVLGGRWAYGGDSPGFWWGQLHFSSGPKVELLTPSGGPDAAFLERFLATRGAGPHHYNFYTPDIRATLAKLAAQGIEPVSANLESPTWKEAFLHPKTAHGIVIQVAQQNGPAPSAPPPAELPPPGQPSALTLIEHHVTDLTAATRLFRDALDGDATPEFPTPAGPAVDLSWPDGHVIRLLRPPAGADLPSGGALHHLAFTRPAGYSPAERHQASLLSARLGVTLDLA